MALVNAIKTTFPKVGHILCTRHLQVNAIRNLNKHNDPEASKNKLINSIFSPSGLLSSNSLVTFLEREQEILKSFEDSPAFKYLTEKLFPTIKEKVFTPRLQNEKIPYCGKLTF